MRYHPAIIAQAAATMSILSEGRFFLGVGSGERLNEHIVGGGWQSVAVRHEMLREALQIIRSLWSGGFHSFGGKHLTIEDACIYDLPDELPEIICAAGRFERRTSDSRDRRDVHHESRSALRTTAANGAASGVSRK
jgi:G6PDH family F420-dependent oxidoreductase